jgi:hypothetical protein
LLEVCLPFLELGLVFVDYHGLILFLLLQYALALRSVQVSRATKGFGSLLEEFLAEGGGSCMGDPAWEWLPTPVAVRVAEGCPGSGQQWAGWGAAGSGSISDSGRQQEVVLILYPSSTDAEAAVTRLPRAHAQYVLQLEQLEKLGEVSHRQKFQGGGGGRGVNTNTR